MRYQDPQLLDRLASEYVLGTLSGTARRRFERLMTESFHVRSVVWRWEKQLGPLAEAVTPVQPRAQVWRAVEQRTGARAERAPWYERLGLWRGLSLAATAAALVMAVMLVTRVTTVAPPQYVAVFSGEKAQPLWVVKADAETGRLEIRSINAAAPGVGRDYELWLLPPGGAAPRSMGLLPTGGARRDAQLPVALASQLGTAQGLAISLEPTGGSPTGAPTGPVVYQAAILTI
jgi:anti-sigma-K factor RskA